MPLINIENKTMFHT